MTDDSDPQNPMVVTLHKENQPDFSVEQSAFDTVGVSVDNAVPIEELEALADEWEDKILENTLPRSGKTNEAQIYANCQYELTQLIQEYQGESNE